MAAAVSPMEERLARQERELSELRSLVRQNSLRLTTVEDEIEEDREHLKVTNKTRWSLLGATTAHAKKFVENHRKVHKAREAHRTLVETVSNSWLLKLCGVAAWVVIVWLCWVAIAGRFGYLHHRQVYESQVYWTSMGGTYPLTLKCLAPGGCLVLNTFSNRTGASRFCAERVPAAQKCLSLAFDEEQDLRGCYGDDRFDGIYCCAASGDDDAALLGDDAPICATISKMVHRNSYIPMPSYQRGGEAYEGIYVATKNLTARAAPDAKKRHEFFTSRTQMNFDAERVRACARDQATLTASRTTGVTPASVAAAAATWTQDDVANRLARTVYASYWYDIKVTEKAYTDILGTLGGIIEIRDWLVWAVSLVYAGAVCLNWTFPTAPWARKGATVKDASSTTTTLPPRGVARDATKSEASMTSPVVAREAA